MPPVMNAMQWLGPPTLFVLMGVVGLELTPADFRRVAAAPLAVLGGTLGQIALLPLLTWGIVAALDVPAVFAAGAVIVAVSPPAGMSTLLSALAGANIALAVTLVALASVLCVVTLPTIAALGLRWFLGEAIAVEVPVAMLITQLALSLLLPIGLGMAVRARWPEFVAVHQRRLQRAAFVAIVAVMAIAIPLSDTGSLTFGAAGAGLVAAATWALAAMAIGWCVGGLLGLCAEDRFTLLLAFSTRNIGVAAIVAMSGLGRLDLVLFAGAYVATAYPIAALAAISRRALVTRVTAPAGEST